MSLLEAPNIYRAVPMKTTSRIILDFLPEHKCNPIIHHNTCTCTYIRVLSIGGGGAGGKLPPQSTQLLPQRRVARQKREREGEGGGGERILYM